MSLDSWVIEGVAGRPPREDDLDTYRALLADPEVARGLYWRKFDEEETRRWHAADLEHWAEHGWGPWILSDGPGGPVVGRGGARHSELLEGPVVELVRAVLSGSQGRGVAGAAAAASTRLAEERGLPHVVALIETANVASCRVAERAGLRLERELDYDERPHRLYRV